MIQTHPTQEEVLEEMFNFIENGDWINTEQGKESDALYSMLEHMQEWFKKKARAT